MHTSSRRTLFLLTLALVCAFPAPSHATTGGPTYVYSFTYNPTNESVYYVRQSEGGRGCPPELWKMSLATGKTDVVFSCSQGEALMQANGSGGATAVQLAINTIVKDFKDLTPIHLPKNTIAVDVDFVRAENTYPESDGIAQSHFTTRVYQGTKKVAEMPIIGCAIDQPFLFAGYAIPGYDKKIVLLLSTKGDCFEGGYVNETLYPVGGVDGLDKTYTSDAWKYQSPLLPSAATLVVLERDRVGAAATPTADDKPVGTATSSASLPAGPGNDWYPASVVAAIAGMGTILGLILGALFFRK
ncbi:MAG: hypothetical protein WC030_00585 [Candidatus Paceibacterota bacterium]